MTDRVDPPQGNAEVARILMEAIMAFCMEVQRQLEIVYVQLKVGGGIFKGRKMSEEVARQTRYELIAYVAAVETILMENWPNRPQDISPVLVILESAVFSLKLVSARPAYDEYRKRYYDLRPTDSRILPREGLVHLQFVQKLMDIWSFYPALNGTASNLYSQAMIELTRCIEAAIHKVLTDVWPAK